MGVQTLKKIDMKIFEIIYKDGEKQWVAANTNIDALREVLSIEDSDLDLMEDIIELPDDKLDELKVVNTEYDQTDAEDWESATFREYLKEHVQGEAQIVSATFYEI